VIGHVLTLAAIATRKGNRNPSRPGDRWAHGIGFSKPSQLAEKLAKILAEIE
jgi:hypothetical protein